MPLIGYHAPSSFSFLLLFVALRVKIIQRQVAAAAVAAVVVVT